MVIEVEHPTVGRLRLIGNPIKMSDLEEGSALPPPLLGQHTDEVLSEKLNLTAEQIVALRREGALGS
jgi:succinate--hydroxymethylglutarate CoA-transferase